MRLIDADALCRYANNMKDKTIDANDIMRFPAVEAEPIIHCRDCKHRVYTEDGESYDLDIVCDYWETDGLYADDFCSAGQRRTADD